MNLNGNASAKSLIRGKIKDTDVIYYDTYSIAVQNGFEGTQQEWLDTLKPDALVLVTGDPIHLVTADYNYISEKFSEGKVIVLCRYGEGVDPTVKLYYCVGYRQDGAFDAFLFRHIGKEVETITVSAKYAPEGPEAVVSIETAANVIHVTIDNGKASHTAAQILEHVNNGGNAYCNGASLSYVNKWQAVFDHNYDGEESGVDFYGYLMTSTVIDELGFAYETSRNLPLLSDDEVSNTVTWSSQKIAEEIGKGGGKVPSMDDIVEAVLAALPNGDEVSY